MRPRCQAGIDLLRGGGRVRHIHWQGLRCGLFGRRCRDASGPGRRIAQDIRKPGFNRRERAAEPGSAIAAGVLDRHCRCHAGDERDAQRHTVDRDPNRHPLRQSDPRIDRVDVGQPLRAESSIRHADAARHGGHMPEDGLSASHQPCLDAIAWKTLTFIAALRHDRILAPWLIEGAINGESFLLYVEKVLAPAPEPG